MRFARLKFDGRISYHCDRQAQYHCRGSDNITLSDCEAYNHSAFVSTNAMLAKARTENFHPLSFSVCIRFRVLLYHRSPFQGGVFCGQRPRESARLSQLCMVCRFIETARQATPTGRRRILLQRMRTTPAGKCSPIAVMHSAQVHRNGEAGNARRKIV